MQSRSNAYFPSGRSVLRRVHGARIVGTTYGQRALLMQATHPLAFAGLTANTTGLEAPFARLAHTAETMEQVYFGTREEADRVTAQVRAMHSRVRGQLAEPAGGWPAGSEYAADDPEFLLWVWSGWPTPPRPHTRRSSGGSPIASGRAIGRTTSWLASCSA